MGPRALGKNRFLAGTCGVDKTSERARDYRHWTSQANRNRREGGWAQSLREWPSHWHYDKSWLEPTKSKMAEDSTFSGPWTSLYAHCNVLALQIANICWIIKKTRAFQKNIFFCFIDYAKAFDCVDHNKLWKILQEMEIPDHLTCLLRNLYAGQEATVRTGHGTTDWFQIGKGVHQGCILSPCLFNLHAEYIRQNVTLDEAQAGTKIVGRNINNLRYADDTTLMAESEELKSLLMKVK